MQLGKLLITGQEVLIFFVQVIAICARPNVNAVELETVPVRRSTQLWSPKPANGIPKEFIDAAE